MFIIDFLFNIWLSLFKKSGKGGRVAAVIFLSPSLTFLIMAMLIMGFNAVLNIRIITYVSAGLGSLISFLLFALILNSLRISYVKNERDAGEIKYPKLYVLLVPVLFFGSLFLFVFSIDRFG